MGPRILPRELAVVQIGQEAAPFVGQRLHGMPPVAQPLYRLFRLGRQMHESGGAGVFAGGGAIPTDS